MLFRNRCMQVVELKDSTSDDNVVLRNDRWKSITWSSNAIMVSPWLTSYTGGIFGTFATMASVKACANIDGAMAIRSLATTSKICFPLLAGTCPAGTDSTEEWRRRRRR